MKNKLFSHDQGYFEKGYTNLCGIDEVGRGALAGPVVAAAVVYKKGIFIDGVKDSKALVEKNRDLFFELITEKAEDWSVGIIPNVVIDRVNILRATELAMERAVNFLRINPDFILVDGKRLKHFPFEHEPIIKGDGKSFVIASASIIAKVVRDRIMCKLSTLYPEYGFIKNKGYGTSAHISALNKSGPTPFHRRSFSPVYQPGFVFE